MLLMTALRANSCSITSFITPSKINSSLIDVREYTKQGLHRNYKTIQYGEYILLIKHTFHNVERNRDQYYHR